MATDPERFQTYLNRLMAVGNDECGEESTHDLLLTHRSEGPVFVVAHIMDGNGEDVGRVDVLDIDLSDARFDLEVRTMLQQHHGGSAAM